MKKKQKRKKVTYKLKNPRKLVAVTLIFAALTAGIVIGVSSCVRKKRPEPEPQESIVPVTPDESGSAQEPMSSKGRLALSELPGQIEAMARAMVNANRDNYKKDPDLPPSEARLVVGYKYCILLSPGHGDMDPGSVNEALGIKEKDVTLAVALAIRDYIEDHASDIKVMMSRTDDSLLSYAEQAALANNQEVDFALLIHMNSYSGAGVARGAEAMYQKKGDKTVVARSADAAALITKTIAEALDSYDRGLAKDNYLDIGLKMPGVLVEVGFISDSVEGPLLASSEGQKALGEALGQALIDMIRTYPEQTDEEEE